MERVVFQIGDQVEVVLPTMLFPVVGERFEVTERSATDLGGDFGVLYSYVVADEAGQLFVPKSAHLTFKKVA